MSTALPQVLLELLHSADGAVRAQGVELLRTQLGDAEALAAVCAHRIAAPLPFSNAKLAGLTLPTRLSGAVLNCADLSHVQWANGHVINSNVQGASLRRANLRGAFFQQVNLTGADLQDADLRGAVFTGCSLNDALLDGALWDEHTVWPDSTAHRHTLYIGPCARLAGALLTGRDLQKANLQGSDLRDADLRHCNLRGANFRGGRLMGANFSGADLHGAIFHYADLSGATVAHHQLQHADIRCAAIDAAPTTVWHTPTTQRVPTPPSHAPKEPPAPFASRAGCLIQNVNWQGADLRGVDLRGAVLQQVCLRDADLRGAILAGATVDEVDFHGATLSDTDGRDIKGPHRLPPSPLPPRTMPNMPAAQHWERAMASNAGEDWAALAQQLSPPLRERLQTWVAWLQHAGPPQRFDPSANGAPKTAWQPHGRLDGHLARIHANRHRREGSHHWHRQAVVQLPPPPWLPTIAEHQWVTTAETGPFSFILRKTKTLMTFPVAQVWIWMDQPHHLEISPLASPEMCHTLLRALRSPVLETLQCSLAGAQSLRDAPPMPGLRGLYVTDSDPIVLADLSESTPHLRHLEIVQTWDPMGAPRTVSIPKLHLPWLQRLKIFCTTPHSRQPPRLKRVHIGEVTCSRLLVPDIHAEQIVGLGRLLMRP